MQERDGFISQEAVAQIGARLELAASKVYGVATFYNQFRFNPPGRFHIQVCRGTACHVNSSAELLSAIARELGIGAVRDLDADVVGVGCIGLCAAEPLLDIQLPGRTRLCFAEVTAERVDALLCQVLAGTLPDYELLGQHRHPELEPYPGVPFLDEHPFFALQTRWVLANCGLIDPERIDEYIARQGYRALAATLRNHTREEVCDIVAESGLRGRGGGGFPTGKKWRFALAEEAERKYLICNADEGDPHRLLEGMAIAAYAIGAGRAYVYIRAEYPLAIERLERAITQAREYGFIGENVLGSGFDLEILVKKVVDALADPKKHVVVQHAPSISVTLGEEFGLRGGSTSKE